MKHLTFIALCILLLIFKTQSHSPKGNAYGHQNSKNPNNPQYSRKDNSCKNCKEWQQCVKGKCICKNNLCEQYDQDNSCTSETNNGVCVCDQNKCLEGQFCSNHGQSGDCVECKDNGHCGNYFEVCLDHKCVCNDLKCNQQNQGYICSQDRSQCVRCIPGNNNCDAYQVCQNNQCVCSDDQCSATNQVCDYPLTQNGQCVSCRSGRTQNCPLPYCWNNQCAQCQLASDCPNVSYQYCHLGVCQCQEAKCNSVNQVCSAPDSSCVCADSFCLTLGSLICNQLDGTGTCSVQCRDAALHCGPNQICNASGQCQCSCPQSNQACVGNQCICQDSLCVDSNFPVCDLLTAAGQCVQCRSDQTSKCDGSATPYCSNNQCVQCQAPNIGCNAGQICTGTAGNQQCICDDTLCDPLVCNLPNDPNGVCVQCRDNSKCSSYQTCDLTTPTYTCKCDTSKCGAMVACNVQDVGGVCVAYECLDSDNVPSSGNVNCRQGQLCNLGVCECDATNCAAVGGVCSTGTNQCVKGAGCTLNDYSSSNCDANSVCLPDSSLSNTYCFSKKILCRTSNGYFINGACPAGMGCLPLSNTFDNSPYCVPQCDNPVGVCSTFDCGAGYHLVSGFCAWSYDLTSNVCVCLKDP